MYNVTDNAYTRTELPAGSPPPSHQTQVQAIHNIFQKIQQKENFKVTDEHKTNPITVQAQLKREALQACRNDLNNHWGITKFFMFLLRLTPFKFDIEKKADQILKDTGKLYLKAKELGCKDGNFSEYVNNLNQAWLARPQNLAIIEPLPNGNIKTLYRNPDASLEEFLEAIDTLEPNDLLLLQDTLSNLEDPFGDMLNYKAKDIAPIKKEAFDLRNSDIPNIDVNEDVDDQISHLNDKDLKKLILNTPEVQGPNLLLSALYEDSGRIKKTVNPDGSSGAYVVPDDLKLADDEKAAISLRMRHVFDKLGSSDYPFELIEQLSLENQPYIKDIKYIAQAKSAKDTHKIPNSALNIMNAIQLDKQKDLESLAEKNDTKALFARLLRMDDAEKADVNFQSLLTKVLSNKQSKENLADVILFIFLNLKDDQKAKAYSQINGSALLPKLLSTKLLDSLPNNPDGHNLAFIGTFKKLIDQSNTQYASSLLKKMTLEQKAEAINHVLTKSNPLPLLVKLTDAIDDDNDEMPYSRIADLLINKKERLDEGQLRLLNFVINKMDDDMQLKFLKKLLENKGSLVSFTKLENVDDNLQILKNTLVSDPNNKQLLESNMRYIDLLIATKSTNDILAIYNANDKTELIEMLANKKETFYLMKFLVVRNVLDGQWIKANWKSLKDETKTRIQGDAKLKAFAPIQGKAPKSELITEEKPYRPNPRRKKP